MGLRCRGLRPTTPSLRKTDRSTTTRATAPMASGSCRRTDGSVPTAGTTARNARRFPDAHSNCRSNTSCHLGPSGSCRRRGTGGPIASCVRRQPTPASTRGTVGVADLIRCKVHAEYLSACQAPGLVRSRGGTPTGWPTPLPGVPLSAAAGRPPRGARTQRPARGRTGCRRSASARPMPTQRCARSGRAGRW